MESDSSGMKLNAALKSLTSMLHVFAPHLRSRTLQTLESHIRQAEAVRNVLADESIDVKDVAFYATPPSTEVAEISAAHAGVWRAMLQKTAA